MVFLCIFIQGSIDFFAQGLANIPDFDLGVETIWYRNHRYGKKAQPSHDFVMSSRDACQNPVPKQYSLLFHFKLEDQKRFAVTLLKIEGQISIILDTCGSKLTLVYDGASCAYKNITFKLNEVLASKQWHKIGLSFAEDYVSLFVNCHQNGPSLPGCSMECNQNDDINIGIMTPAEGAFCSSQGMVEKNLQFEYSR